MRISAQLRGARKPGQRIGVVRFRQQDLLPGLRGHIHASANFERMRLVKQRLRCRLPRLSLPRLSLARLRLALLNLALLNLARLGKTHGRK